jgi:AraC family transcriptional regulator of adaptative response/methylated-DNA-[protein]-cysteine methyltransferase
MTHALPSGPDYYHAFFTQDPAWDGRLWVGVTSTGIFCRMGCPARHPKPENCAWYGSVGDCLDAGFRACKRCKPLLDRAHSEPQVQALLAALDARPDHRWTEADIRAMGYDPSTIRRAFHRLYGTTFLDIARQRRIGQAVKALGSGARVIDAQLAAGFDSASGFRIAFAKLMGCNPDDLSRAPVTANAAKASWFDTALGPMVAVADDQALHLLEFADRAILPRELSRLRGALSAPISLGRNAIMDQAEAELTDFFAGRNARFQTPLALHGTEFTKMVWRALCDIPAGQTISYAQLAQTIGRPTATRAVARANGANQIAIMIPCHRVIGADGSLTGYGGGLWRKEKLIRLEHQYARDGAKAAL